MIYATGRLRFTPPADCDLRHHTFKSLRLDCFPLGCPPGSLNLREMESKTRLRRDMREME